MIGRHRGFALVWFVSVCVGCSSAPIRYYTLTPPPNTTLPGLAATISIDVRVVHIPPQLKRAELMVRTGPTDVTILENERWASPVTDEVKDALHLELQRRLGSVNGSRSTFAKITLDLDVQRLEAEPGRYAMLEASWRAAWSTTDAPSTGTRATICTFRANEKIPAGYAGMVEGYQREIAALAEAIVAVLTSSANGNDASCH
jgi:uncharacterized lipoprotein YmbA